MVSCLLKHCSHIDRVVHCSVGAVADKAVPPSRAHANNDTVDVQAVCREELLPITVYAGSHERGRACNLSAQHGRHAAEVRIRAVICRGGRRCWWCWARVWCRCNAANSTSAPRISVLKLDQRTRWRGAGERQEGCPPPPAVVEPSSTFGVQMIPHEPRTSALIIQWDIESPSPSIFFTKTFFLKK